MERDEYEDILNDEGITDKVGWYLYRYIFRIPIEKH